MKKSVLTWLGFSAMCLGMFMAILDIQVVASSLTNIGTALAIPDYRLGWIQTAYLTAEIIAIPLTGFLTRAFTLRGMFVAATLGFTLASLACAYSTGTNSLIAIRVIQGFFGGMLIPPVFTGAFILIGEERRVLATTIAGACAMVAPAVGPVVGGYLTEYFSWRWIFLVNVPPGLLVAAVVAACVRTGAPDWSVLRRIDYVTMLLAALFLATLEIALNEGPRYDWRGAYIMSLAGISLLSGDRPPLSGPF